MTTVRVNAGETLEQLNKQLEDCTTKVRNLKSRNADVKDVKKAAWEVIATQIKIEEMKVRKGLSSLESLQELKKVVSNAIATEILDEEKRGKHLFWLAVEAIRQAQIKMQEENQKISSLQKMSNMHEEAADAFGDIRVKMDKGTETLSLEKFLEAIQSSVEEFKDSQSERKKAREILPNSVVKEMLPMSSSALVSSELGFLPSRSASEVKEEAPSLDQSPQQQSDPYVYIFESSASSHLKQLEKFLKSGEIKPQDMNPETADCLSRIAELLKAKGPENTPPAQTASFRPF